MRVAYYKYCIVYFYIYNTVTYTPPRSSDTRTGDGVERSEKLRINFLARKTRQAVREELSHVDHRVRGKPGARFEIRRILIFFVS